MKKKIIITGANGFIGQNLVRFYAAKDFEVYAFVHSKKEESFSNSNVKYILFDLTFDPKEYEKYFDGADYLVHAAYMKFKSGNNADTINSNGTKNLLDLSNKHHTRMVYLSTMSAHNEAISHYGKSKAKLERLFKNSEHLVLKLGLVVGEGGGLIGEIKKVLSKSKFIPLVSGGNQPIHTIHVDDVAHIIDQGLNSESLSGTFLVGEKKSRSLRSVYDIIGTKLGNKPTFVNLPYPLMYLAVKVVSLIPIGPDISTENLLGLKQLKSFEDQAGSFFPNYEVPRLEEKLKNARL